MKSLALFTAAALVVASAALAQQANPGAHFIENWDQNSDASVSADEIASKRLDVFASFDANDDGQLDAEEYALFDEARANDQAQMGAGHGMGMRRMAEPMTRAFSDTDGDGIVTAAEFAAASPRMFTALDRTADGKITTDDFGAP